MTAEMAQTSAGEPESPASVLRRAARTVREKAEAATPGPWERPLDVRHKCFVGAALPGDEYPHDHISGIIQDYGQGGYRGRYIGQRERCEVVSAPTWGNGKFYRGSFIPPGETRRPPSRSGRDLDYIALMNPLVGLALADWLDVTAVRVTEYVRLDTPECAHEDCACERVPAWGCDWCGCWLDGGGCTCWDAALNVARACLQATGDGS